MRKFIIPLASLSLALISLITLSSVSPALMQRQVLFFAVSFGIFFAISRTNFRNLLPLGKYLYWALIIVLIGLLIFGRTTRGIVSWIDLGWGLKFQPSQLAVFASFLMFLEKFSLKKHLSEIETIKFLFLAVLPGLLILSQPDFGTAAIYFISLLPLVLIQKFPPKAWKILIVSGIIASIIGWSFFLKPYQKQRITSFFNGYSEEQSNASYNARQALIAVGSGQIFGRGLGHGVQSQLRFLPERQTDFIFASLAEEWGLVGSTFVIGLFFSLEIFLLWLTRQIKDTKKQIFITGVLVQILIQSFINIGMNLGLMPITGITLPLVSYGGSSILATMILLGVVQGFALENPVL